VQERGRPGVSEGAVLPPSGGQQHETGGPLVVSGVGVGHVEEHGEDGAGGVHPQRHPPHQLLVQLLLKVLEHQQPDGEAGQRPRQVRHVRNGRTHLLRGVPVVDRETNVGAC